jgi:oligopeptide/dipeptide ABC transporter ATP-binding protein
MPLLSIEGLRTYYHTEQGTLKAVDGVDFTVAKGERLAIIGESGSGKSTLGLSITRLLPPSAEIVEGKILLEGAGDLAALSPSQMRRVRGKRIGMVFQDPRAHLNPIMKVGDQIADGIVENLGCTKAVAMEKALELLESMKLASPQTRIRQYPHQLSGGMQQRVLLAMAMGPDPDLLIADEPTSALDVVTQSQIVEVLLSTIRNRNMSLIFITHDIDLALGLADRVCVMYAGTIFELASRDAIAQASRNPYTISLLKSTPTPEMKGSQLALIPGYPPNLLKLPVGCSFNPRCSYAQERCHRERPALEEVGPGHLSACHFANSLGEDR